jgi:hypothetical protein
MTLRLLVGVSLVVPKILKMDNSLQKDKILVRLQRWVLIKIYDIGAEEVKILVPLIHK